MKNRLPGLLLVILVSLAGCTTTPQAPVIERIPQAKKAEAAKPAPPPAKKAAPPAIAEADQRPDTYAVKKGDTLYSIGLEFGFDYKEIAQRNGIQPPYIIYVGQPLILPKADAAKPVAEASPVAAPQKIEPSAIAKQPVEPPLITEPKAVKEPYSAQAMAAAKPAEAVPKSVPKPVAVEKPAEPAKTADSTKVEAIPEKSAPPADDEVVEWAWPTSGKVITGFNENASAKGIDIGGTTGQAISAAASGKVVYSGSGLRGYGKLIIIKHNRTYLSAYAHNSQILVKEGQEVGKGQKIAEMGKTDSDLVKLHFEIRRLGKPVDPVKYLPSSN